MMLLKHWKEITFQAVTYFLFTGSAQRHEIKHVLLWGSGGYSAILSRMERLFTRNVRVLRLVWGHVEPRERGINFQWEKERQKLEQSVYRTALLGTAPAKNVERPFSSPHHHCSPSAEMLNSGTGFENPQSQRSEGVLVWALLYCVYLIMCIINYFIVPSTLQWKFLHGGVKSDAGTKVVIDLYKAPCLRERFIRKCFPVLVLILCRKTCSCINNNNSINFLIFSQYYWDFFKKKLLLTSIKIVPHVYALPLTDDF